MIRDTFSAIWTWGKRGLIIVVIGLGIILICKTYNFLSNKIGDRDKIISSVTSKPDNKPTEVKKEVKQPIIGIGKGAKPKIEISIPKEKKDSVKIVIRGDDFEIISQKGDSLRLIIYKAPIIRIKPTFGIGLMGTLTTDSILSTDWGLYLKFQPLEVYRFGFGGFISNKGYGFSVSYLIKRFAIDGLFEWNHKKLWGGISVRI